MGVPIVLVHGMRVSGSMWRPQVEWLRERGRTVVAPDLPGHGSRRGEVFSLGAAVDTVLGAIEGVGGRALLAGLSLGGFVSIAAAGAARVGWRVWWRPAVRPSRRRRWRRCTGFRRC
ncbi:alpha/beta fold hydrolase [Nocardiopsis sp. CNR-923]|uniref:alpha/beta fold hydrolase n=1 Tax=Nocardiopsis sp. CNR-923 TaxID=1904965 RepID=UPI000AE42F83|nr:alpha/beta fold hydrolase [Nocardiopsis sp. CNR-923]